MLQQYIIGIMKKIEKIINLSINPLVAIVNSIAPYILFAFSYAILGLTLANPHIPGRIVFIIIIVFFIALSLIYPLINLLILIISFIKFLHDEKNTKKLLCILFSTLTIVIYICYLNFLWNAMMSV